MASTKQLAFTRIDEDFLRERLTLPSTKVWGFSGYAQAITSRYRLTGLPDPKEFEMFSGLDFTQEPNSCNHQPKLLKNFGRPALSLFYFYRYWSNQFTKGIIAQFKKDRKPYRASVSLTLG